MVKKRGKKKTFDNVKSFLTHHYFLMFVFVIVFVGLFLIAKYTGESDQAIAGEAMRGRSLDLSRLSVDKVAMYHYAAYAKDAGFERVNPDDFWKIVASSNVIYIDSIVFLNDNPEYKDQYLSALDLAVNRQKYSELKKWYSVMYSSRGFNYNPAKHQKLVWYIIRERSIKKEIFNQTRFTAFVMSENNQMKVWVYDFTLAEIDKPMNPYLFKNVLKAVEQQRVSSGQGNYQISFNSVEQNDNQNFLTGGAIGVVPPSGSSLVSCGEGDGETGGGHNPVGTSVDPMGPGTGNTVDPLSGKTTHSQNGGPCSPFGNMNLPGSAGDTGDEGGEDSNNNLDEEQTGTPSITENAKENSFERPDSWGTSPSMADKARGQVNNFLNSDLGQSLKTTLKTTASTTIQTGELSFFVGAVVTWGGDSEFDPDGDVGNIMGPPCGGLGGLNLDCFDLGGDDDDCGPANTGLGGSGNKGWVASDSTGYPTDPSSPGWGNNCGGVGGADPEMINEDIEQSHISDPIPTELFASVSLVGGELFLSDFKPME